MIRALPTFAVAVFVSACAVAGPTPFAYGERARLVFTNLEGEALAPLDTAPTAGRELRLRIANVDVQTPERPTLIVRHRPGSRVERTEYFSLRPLSPGSVQTYAFTPGEPGLYAVTFTTRHIVDAAYGGRGCPPARTKLVRLDIKADDGVTPAPETAEGFIGAELSSDTALREDETLRIAVRFDAVPLSGVLVMLTAGTILFGGIAVSLRALLGGAATDAAVAEEAAAAARDLDPSI